MKTISKSKIIKKLQKMDWISKHWRVKDFLIIENGDFIIFSYYHGDMGLVNLINYQKKDGFTTIYELDNYFGTEKVYHTLYI